MATCLPFLLVISFVSTRMVVQHFIAPERECVFEPELPGTATEKAILGPLVLPGHAGGCVLPTVF